MRKHSPTNAGPQLIDIGFVRELPQSTEPWQLAIRKTTIPGKAGSAFDVLLLVSPRCNKLRQLVPLGSALGDEGEIVSALERGMVNPGGSLVPSRPPAIWVDDERVAELIRLPMESCGIRVKVKSELPAVGLVMEALASAHTVYSEAPLVGAAVREEELLVGAAAIADIEPWRHLPSELPLYIRSTEANIPDSVVLVLGQMREVEGLVSHNNVEAYRACVERANGRPSENADEGHISTLLFDTAYEASPATKEAFATRQLPMAHSLYPRFMHLRGDGDPELLDDEDHALRLLRDMAAVVSLVENRTHTLDQALTLGCSVPSAFGACHVRGRPDLLPGGKLGPLPDAALGLPLGLADDFSLDDLDSELDPPLPDLIDGEHTLMVADVPVAVVAEQVGSVTADKLLAGDQPGSVRALVVRSTKKLAARACRDLRDVQELAFGALPDGDGREFEMLLACGFGEPLYVLTTLATRDDVPRLYDFVTNGGAVGHVAIVVLSGGIKRALKHVDSKMVVGVYLLPYRLLPKDF